MSGQALLERTRRALGAKSPGDLLRENRAIVGPRANQLSDAAQQALELLHKGLEPGAQEMAALEFSIRLARPSILCAPGDVGELGPERAGAFPGWTAFRDVSAKFLDAIGRIERLEDPKAPGGASYDPIGTGFLVREDVLATNRHVLDQLSFGSMRLEQGMARFDIDIYRGHPAAIDPVDILGVVGIHEELDLALLRCAPIAFSETRQPLSIGSATAEDELRVCVVGHPADDSRSPAFRSVVFEGMYGVKRASPGEIIGGNVHLAFHDCSTLGGNSGSPVLDMATAEVVGIHRSGFFLFRNEAVRAKSVSVWVATKLSAR